MGYNVKIGRFYIVKDGELVTHYDGRHNVYDSGVKMTPHQDKATVFDTATEASKYQSIVGVKGKRGQLVKAKEAVKEVV